MDETPGQDRPPGQPGRPGLGGLVRRLRPDLGPLRHSADFRRLYFGQAASLAGSMITYVAMPYQAYQLTHESLVVGLLSLAELGPLVAAALFGGLLADRMDRRLMILITECCAVGGAAVLAINAMAWHQLWVLFVIAVAGGGCYGMQRPSLEALVPQIAPRDELAAAA
ncbi:MAG TPA: MFS transporter, partial [Streptosporangiaceae bacterium]